MSDTPTRKIGSLSKRERKPGAIPPANDAAPTPPDTTSNKAISSRCALRHSTNLRRERKRRYRSTPLFPQKCVHEPVRHTVPSDSQAATRALATSSLKHSNAKYNAWNWSTTTAHHSPAAKRPCRAADQ